MKVKDGKIEVSMEDYANSVEEIKEIRKADGADKLKQYTRKIYWLLQGTRLDLSYSALQLARKNNSATMSDLRNVNKVVE